MIEYSVIRFEEIPSGMIREQDLNEIPCPKRRRERAMVLAIVRARFGLSATLSHTPDGAPEIPSRPEIYVSVSHSGNRAAVAFSTKGPVGIDIQEPSDRLRRVATRFLSERELPYWGADNDRLLKAWTIKEAVYKASGIKNLTSDEIMLDMDSDFVTVEHSGTISRYRTEYPEPGLTVCEKIY